jgi:peptidoglycan hydrolase-like protein with peptidoglycan-binding domain
MPLTAGSPPEPVKALQRGLNRLGSILLVDGDFGPATADAVADARATLALPGPPEADDLLQSRIAAVADPFPPLTAAGVTFIARAEIAGPREYRRRFSHPVWPSPQSGITIGVGYDLQEVDPGQFDADWGGRLPAADLDLLGHVVGVVGSRSRLDLVSRVDVSLFTAIAVFLSRTLPAFDRLTREAFPRALELPAARRTALVSLVYNRGPSFSDRNRDRQDRREMRAIRDRLALGDVERVAEQIDSMARLWEGRLPGLVKRRHDEARLWRSGFAALQLD